MHFTWLFAELLFQSYLDPHPENFVFLPLWVPEPFQQNQKYVSGSEVQFSGMIFEQLQ